jgi:hypothetical protein
VPRREKRPRLGTETGGGKELKQEEIDDSKAAWLMTTTEIQEKSKPTMVGKSNAIQRQKKAQAGTTDKARAQIRWAPVVGWVTWPDQKTDIGTATRNQRWFTEEHLRSINTKSKSRKTNSTNKIQNMIFSIAIKQDYNDPRRSTPSLPHLIIAM